MPWIGPPSAGGDPEAWLYFYEHFLEAYDNDLRKLTGSYYTPPRWSPPWFAWWMTCCGTRRASDSRRALPPTKSRWRTRPSARAPTCWASAAHRGDRARTARARAGRIRAALKRIIGFELQFGPFAVAQLRLLAEVADLLKVKGTVPADVHLRLYVTDTSAIPMR